MKINFQRFPAPFGEHKDILDLDEDSFSVISTPVNEHTEDELPDDPIKYLGENI